MIIDRVHTFIILFALFNFLTACRVNEEVQWEKLPDLPEPVSNNAVAAVNHEGKWYLYSFMGLGEGKTWRDIHSKSFKYDIAAEKWTRIADVPGDSGRLAATAVSVNGQIYLFGGYTVAEDGSEKSVPDVYRLDPSTDSFIKLTEMPVPVDDAVSLVYRDRYIFLVSGWHNTGNVDNVQVFDTREKRWRQATPFPGEPVFGHAGGIVENRMVISDGVKIVSIDQGNRRFEMSGDNWVGCIDPNEVTEIEWVRLPEHPGDPKYRMAALGAGRKVIYTGGSGNPYNYNGIGYNREPSQPDSLIFSYDSVTRKWIIEGYQNVSTMDHRSLVTDGEWLYIIGGMKSGQQVSKEVYRFKIPGL